MRRMFVCVPRLYALCGAHSSAKCNGIPRPGASRVQALSRLGLARVHLDSRRPAAPRCFYFFWILKGYMYAFDMIRPSTSVLLLGPPERTSKNDPPPGQRPSRSALQRQRTGHSHSAQATQARSGRVTAHHRAPGSGVSPVRSEKAPQKPK